MARTRQGRFVVAGLALASALALAAPTPLSAQAPPPEPLPGTPAEVEAYDLVKQNLLVSGRKRAEEVLEQNPDSILGHYALGVALWEADGLLPQAMTHLGAARRLYEDRFVPGAAGSPARLHQEILYATARLASAMEENEYALQILDYHDALHEPDLLGERAWVLLRLHRFDEARKVATAATKSSDPWQVSRGKNALCGIEGEARGRDAYRDACLAALEHARAAAAKDPPNPKNDPSLNTPVAVHAYNAALGALAALKPDEAERLALEGTRRPEFTIANPWRLLTRLYTDQGRVGEAVASVREMQRWRVRLPAALRDQDAAETQAALATLLLVAGDGTTARTLLDRALARPDRRGLVSSNADQALGGHALLRRAAFRLEAERRLERASVSGGEARLRGTAAGAWARAQARVDDERITAMLADDELLETTLRTGVRGGIEPAPTWLLGDLVDVLGPGVVAVALERAREAEPIPALAPIHDALEAEVRLARGDDAAALVIAKRALEKLPKSEPLLEARVAAVAAEAARREGSGEYLGLLERAMQRDAGVVRRLGFSLPVILAEPTDGPLAVAAERLARSPRLRAGEPGFTIAFEQKAGTLGACLRSPTGSQLGCATIRPEKDETVENQGARLADEFHAAAFALRVGLMAVDVRSLDGSTTIAGQAQRELMEGTLREAAGEE